MVNIASESYCADFSARASNQGQKNQTYNDSRLSWVSETVCISTRCVEASSHFGRHCLKSRYIQAWTSSKRSNLMGNRNETVFSNGTQTIDRKHKSNTFRKSNRNATTRHKTIFIIFNVLIILFHWLYSIYSCFYLIISLIVERIFL